MPEPVHPCLWFDGQAEAASAFYAGLFPDGRIVSVQRMGPGEDAPAVVVVFEITGRRFLALNGGPQHRFTPAVSFVLSCRDQAEIDRLWSALAADGGAPDHCGWVTDRFGLSWQVVPAALPRLLGDPARAGRVMGALMAMDKIDLAALEAA
jgi:predicted 3-demethylubiquinone-9 3-methyltransferase (glyoxalase superfamily)